jgi:ureidoglycolate hydrolase
MQPRESPSGSENIEVPKKKTTAEHAGPRRTKQFRIVVAVMGEMLAAANSAVENADIFRCFPFYLPAILRSLESHPLPAL